MTLQTEQALESKYVMPTFGRKPVEFVEGKGMYLKDSDGKSYLDFLSGIGVCSLGHCHPVVVDALQQQTSKLIHVSNYYYIEKRGEVAQKISNLLNGNLSAEASEGGLPTWKSFFANSGAEANECAIKLARLYAQTKAADEGTANPPSVIVTITKSFHGRTLATLAATAQRVFHKGFEPIPEGFIPTPINDTLALEELFESMGRSICAVMIEPVQGESGVHVCTQEFLAKARELADKYSALLIFDEVQCGIFRTGKPFAFQNYNVVPDIVTIAKGVASGMPAGACAAKAEIADVMQPGKHGSTFGGSNLACAAMLATLNELSKPGFAEHVIETGDYLQSKLAEMKPVEEVRGLGLMVGADINYRLNAHDVVGKALENGLVINATGDQTLRFLPPLIATRSDVDEFLQRLAASM